MAIQVIEGTEGSDRAPISNRQKNNFHTIVTKSITDENKKNRMWN